MHPSRPLARVVLPLAGLSLVAGGLGAAAAHAAPSAQARAAAVSVTIKLDDTQSTIMGAVSSPKAVCKSGRPVALYFANPGDPSFEKVRTATSKPSGAWKVPGPGGSIPAGRYYVSIAGNVDCKPVKSKTIKAAAG